MTQVWNLVCTYTVFIATLWGTVYCEQCGDGSAACLVHDAEEETSLLQVHTQTSSRGKLSDEDDQGSRRNDVPIVSLLIDTQPQRSLANSFLVKAASDLGGGNCTVPEDQASCSRAMSLADSLTLLTRGSENMVLKASEITFLRSWFQNPAGPGGFFNYLDTDKSQSLSATELSKHGASDLMQLIDIDNDRKCSREECRHFLRGCAILFKALPSGDEAMVQTPLPVMLRDADTVTIWSTVATGHFTNPFKAAASELEENCSNIAHPASCDMAGGLAKLLVNLTAGLPPNQMVEKGSEILSLWNWFQHPGGPVGLFNALDRHQRGAFTEADFEALLDTFPGVPKNLFIHELVEFADTDKDDKISRAECKAFLGGCSMLLQKLPALDLVTATKPLPDVLLLAQSVTEVAHRP